MSTTYDSSEIGRLLTEARGHLAALRGHCSCGSATYKCDACPKCVAEAWVVANLHALIDQLGAAQIQLGAAQIEAAHWRRATHSAAACAQRIRTGQDLLAEFDRMRHVVEVAEQHPDLSATVHAYRAAQAAAAQGSQLHPSQDRSVMTPTALAPARLAEIEQLCEVKRWGYRSPTAVKLAETVPELLAEVRRLQEEVNHQNLLQSFVANSAHEQRWRITALEAGLREACDRLTIAATALRVERPAADNYTAMPSAIARLRAIVDDVTGPSGQGAVAACSAQGGSGQGTSNDGTEPAPCARAHSDLVELARAIIAELRKPSPPPPPVAEPDRDRAAERLTFCLYIYGGYNVNSRGPAGCIMGALDAIAPEVAAEVREHGAHAVYDRRWSEDGTSRAAEDSQS